MRYKSTIWRYKVSVMGNKLAIMRNEVTITTNKSANVRYIKSHCEIQYISTIGRYKVAKKINLNHK